MHNWQTSCGWAKHLQNPICSFFLQWYARFPTYKKPQLTHLHLYIYWKVQLSSPHKILVEFDALHTHIKLCTFFVYPYTLEHCNTVIGNERAIVSLFADAFGVSSSIVPWYKWLDCIWSEYTAYRMRTLKRYISEWVKHKIFTSHSSIEPAQIEKIIKVLYIAPSYYMAYFNWRILAFPTWRCVVILHRWHKFASENTVSCICMRGNCSWMWVFMHLFDRFYSQSPNNQKLLCIVVLIYFTIVVILSVNHAWPFKSKPFSLCMHGLEALKVEWKAFWFVAFTNWKEDTTEWKRKKKHTQHSVVMLRRNTSNNRIDVIFFFEFKNYNPPELYPAEWIFRHGKYLYRSGFWLLGN